MLASLFLISVQRTFPGEEEYASRRQKVLEALETSGGMLLFNGAERKSPGGHPRKRLDRNLFYLTGIEREGAALLLLREPLGELGRELLFLPKPSPLEELWFTPSLNAESASTRSGIPMTSILEIGRLPGFIRNASHLELQPPKKLIESLRQVKSPAEIRRIERAVEITSRTLRKAMRAVEPGIMEYQLAALIEYEFKVRGARGPAFPPIVGSGPNACILHYDRYERQVAAGDLVLIDIGAEYGYYSADITRTVPASGRFTGRERRLYRIVFEAQERTIRSIRPGIPLDELQRITKEAVAEGLMDLGLIQKRSEVKKYLPHGTSHSLGLDVHDPLPDRTLRAGMVITLEPGIYIKEEKLGIRLEDDVLVTETGFKVLSAGLPRNPEDVENWIRGKAF